MENNKELYEKLTRLQWLLQRHQGKVHASSGPMGDPNRGQGRIIALLKIKDDISTKDLSYLLGIRVSSLNESLAKLERNGYITRKASEEDKRVMLIRLTDKGREEKSSENNISSIFKYLTEDEQANLTEYIDRLIVALEEEVGSEDEKNDMHNWMNDVRRRMDPEDFEKLMRKRGFDRSFGDDRREHPFARFGRKKDFEDKE